MHENQWDIRGNFQANRHSVLCKLNAIEKKDSTSLAIRYFLQRSGTERAASPGKGLFEGFGALSQQVKMDFQRQRWKSILSICGNKYTACKVVHIVPSDQIGMDKVCPSHRK